MLTYLKRDIKSKERREVIRHMQQYNNLSAIIESKKLDLMPSPTSTLKESPVQESNHFRSGAEDYMFRSLEIDELINHKKKLDTAYNNVNDNQRLIWDEHFVNRVKDIEIYDDPMNNITKRNYYREKDELLRVVAECLKIVPYMHQF